MIFIDSLKPNKDYLVSMLYDLFWLVLNTSLWIIVINIIFSSSVPLADLAKIGYDSQQVFLEYQTIPDSMIQKAQESYLGTKDFFGMSLALFAGFMAVSILITSTIKGAIWARILGHDYDKKLILEFIKLNYAWYGMWLVLMLITTIFPRNLMIFMLALQIIAMFLLTPVLRAGFDPDKSIAWQFKRFVMRYKQIPRLMLMAVFMYLVLQVILIIAIVTSFSYYVAPMIILCLAFWYVSWTRYYLKMTLR